ncbi:hypothetical protein BDZ85DRAFT_254494, partial [Elsinoe ampelina]
MSKENFADADTVSIRCMQKCLGCHSACLAVLWSCEAWSNSVSLWSSMGFALLLTLSCMLGVLSGRQTYRSRHRRKRL